MSRPHRLITALPASAMTAGAILLLSACSGSNPAAQGPPSINFGSQVSTTPGMPGMSAMPGMPGASAAGSTAAPAGTAAPAAPAAPAGPNAVSITNFAFAPATLTVPVGTSVTWTNLDGEPHTVAANDGSFHSPGLDTNATFSFTFTTAGTFDYICSVHPFMHGTVVVTA
jgi:plastocyanin